jgi:hypothetical protein
MTAVCAKMKFQRIQDVRECEVIDPAGLPTLGPLGEGWSPIAPMRAKGFGHPARDLPELAPAHSGATVLFL